ncbi:hypothetical protein J4V46_24970, partial [Escherichia coli]
MWRLMGVGSANVMVQLAADNIANGYSMTVQPVQASTRTAARGIFEMELCKYAVNAGLNDFNQTANGFAPIFPDTCYHLTHYWPAAADIPVASDNPVHYADAIRYNA